MNKYSEYAGFYRIRMHSGGREEKEKRTPQEQRPFIFE